MKAVKFWVNSKICYKNRIFQNSSWLVTLQPPKAHRNEPILGGGNSSVVCSKSQMPEKSFQVTRQKFFIFFEKCNPWLLGESIFRICHALLIKCCFTQLKAISSIFTSNWYSYFGNWFCEAFRITKKFILQIKSRTWNSYL